MQTEQEIKRNLQTEGLPSKRVRFSEDTKKSDTFTSLLNPDCSVIKNMWIKFFQQGNYERLTVKIALWEKKGLKLEDFFKMQGDALIYWAINYPYVKPLCFIFETVPVELIKLSIVKEEFKSLKWFLMVEGKLETKLIMTAEERLSHRIEKAKLFLSMGSDLKNTMVTIVEEMSNEVMRSELKLFLETAIEGLELDKKNDVPTPKKMKNKR